MFLEPIEPQREWSNKIRDIIGTVAIVGVLVFLFASPVVGRSLEFVETSLFLAGVEMDISNDMLTQEGGDVVVPVVQKPKFPELVVDMVNSDEFSAKSIFVKDIETGITLFGKNEYDERSIASITKLMSALVLLDYGVDWSVTTSVSKDEVFDGHILAGEVFSVRELWDFALVGSSNRAILTLVDLVSERQDFANKMNEKAQRLGMSDTDFIEPTGLDSGNVSTASDIAILLSESLSKEEIRKSLMKTEINITSHNMNKKHHAWNTDWLLLGWIPHTFAEIVGGKTGYIPQSGYNFTVQVADDEGHNISVVVLGAENNEGRFVETEKIASWVFENYSWPETLEHTQQ